MPSRDEEQRAVVRLTLFADVWLTTPAARLEFVNLIQLAHVTTAQYAITHWIAEEKRALALIGVK